MIDSLIRLMERVATLEGRVDNLEAELSRRLDDVERDVSLLQTEVDQAQGDITALEQRVDNWEG